MKRYDFNLLSAIIILCVSIFSFTTCFCSTYFMEYFNLNEISYSQKESQMYMYLALLLMVMATWYLTVFKNGYIILYENNMIYSNKNSTISINYKDINTIKRLNTIRDNFICINYKLNKKLYIQTNLLKQSKFIDTLLSNVEIETIASNLLYATFIVK